MLLDFMSSSPFTVPWFLRPLPGDYNNDNVVDAADYVAWRKNDGTLDVYNTWRANFGTMLGGGAAATSNATVPEPTTIVMMLIGTLALLSPRRAAVS